MEHKERRIQMGLRVYFWLMAGFGIGALVWTAAIPADERGAILLGFSAARLALLAVILFLALGFFWAGWLTTNHSHFTKKLMIGLADQKVRPVMLTLSGLLILGGWLAAFMPAYWFRVYQFYFVRLQPLLVWLGLAGLAALILLCLPGMRQRWLSWRDSLKNQQELLRAAGITLAIFAVIWLIAAVTGLGIIAEPYFWDEASVPLLAVQIVLCVLITVLLERWVFSSPKLVGSRYVSPLIFFGLWVFAFLLWNATPLRHSYFAPGPHPPNYLFYPYSDAEFYDVSAQYVLLGRGVLNGFLMDKPLYAMFLAVVHAVAGLEYDETIRLQIAVLAVMPALLYLLGNQMVNRPAGLLMGLLAAFHQRNAIAVTPFIKVSHSKLLMTEYPTALLLVAFALFAFRWLKSDRKTTWVDAVMAGGLLGLAMLVRPNALMVLPFVLLLAIAANWRQARKWLIGSTVILSMVVITVLPFLLEIPRGFNEPYLVIKIRAILETRILTDQPRGFIPLEEQLAAHNALPAGAMVQSEGNLLDDLERFAYVPRHFFHNLIMTVMLLPNTFALHDLRHTLEAPYWKNVQQWTGELPPGAALFLPLNLILLAVGVGAAWQRNRAAGLVPLMMLPGYFLANSLARNSGWRYLVPTDWVILVYFAIGVLVLLRWLLDWLGVDDSRRWAMELSRKVEAVKPATFPNKVAIPLLASLVFVLIGLSLPLSERLVPDKYPPLDSLTLYEKVKTAGLPVDKDAFRGFMNSPNAYLNYGQGLYPRFYIADEGEPQPNLPLKARPYPRFTISILAWDTYYTVLLPMREPIGYFPHGEEVVVLGCKDSREPFIDAYAIIVMSDPPQVYQRSYATELVCPFAPPVETP